MPAPTTACEREQPPRASGRSRGPERPRRRRRTGAAGSRARRRSRPGSAPCPSGARAGARALAAVGTTRRMPRREQLPPDDCGLLPRRALRRAERRGARNRPRARPRDPPGAEVARKDRRRRRSRASNSWCGCTSKWRCGVRRERVAGAAEEADHLSPAHVPVLQDPARVGGEVGVVEPVAGRVLEPEAPAADRVPADEAERAGHHGDHRSAERGEEVVAVVPAVGDVAADAAVGVAPVGAAGDREVVVRQAEPRRDLQRLVLLRLVAFVLPRMRRRRRGTGGLGAGRSGTSTCLGSAGPTTARSFVVASGFAAAAGAGVAPKPTSTTVPAGSWSRGSSRCKASGALSMAPTWSAAIRSPQASTGTDSPGPSSTGFPSTRRSETEPRPSLALTAAAVTAPPKSESERTETPPGRQAEPATSTPSKLTTGGGGRIRARAEAARRRADGERRGPRGHDRYRARGSAVRRELRRGDRRVLRRGARDRGGRRGRGGRGRARGRAFGSGRRGRDGEEHGDERGDPGSHAGDCAGPSRDPVEGIRPAPARDVSCKREEGARGGLSRRNRATRGRP